MAIIQFFYEMWKVICVISVLASCASVISLIKWGKGNNSKYISGILLAIFIVVAGFSALIGNSCVKVPNVTNIMSVDNASQTLTELGLKVKLRDGKVLSDFENTIVTYQSINGELVFKGTCIEIDYVKNSGNQTGDSSGNQNLNSNLRQVPLLIGMEKTIAIQKLEELDLKGMCYWTGDGDLGYENNYVIAQSISAGSLVEPETEIQMELVPYVPKGGKSIVPNVAGMEQAEATELLRQNGLQFKVWWTMEEGEKPSEKYYVKAQSVAADTEVEFGTVIELELKPLLP